MSNAKSIKLEVSKRIVWDSGTYLCFLRDIDTTKKTRPFGAPETDAPSVPQFGWEFVPLEEIAAADDDQKFIGHYTNVKYGNEKASLTNLVNGFETKGRALTDEEAAQIDLGWYIGKWWAVIVVTENDSKGKPLSKVKGVRPLKPAEVKEVKAYRDSIAGLGDETPPAE